MSTIALEANPLIDSFNRRPTSEGKHFVEVRSCLFSYDAIGSFERTQYSATGSGQAYVIPFLDNVIGNRNRTEEKPVLSKEEVVELMKHAFVSAGERDIYTGDSLEIMVMTKDRVKTETFQLKKD